MTNANIARTCRNCVYLKKLKKEPQWKKTDDGGVNWKYNYKWTIECEKEGKFTEIIEGTARFCEVPKCSLWRQAE